MLSIWGSGVSCNKAVFCISSAIKMRVNKYEVLDTSDFRLEWLNVHKFVA